MMNSCMGLGGHAVAAITENLEQIAKTFKIVRQGESYYENSPVRMNSRVGTPEFGRKLNATLDSSEFLKDGLLYGAGALVGAALIVGVTYFSDQDVMEWGSLFESPTKEYNIVDRGVAMMQLVGYAGVAVTGFLSAASLRAYQHAQRFLSE